ncbi:uncharacterized protein LOC129220779 [Uloborus diversus]|uniref:uncharacterized protein LOC129220779 n=1 Tax=Uloborus diversus TaxID=327109 RepID=UPI00240930AB|nr:uncharacterized protein LOC129220779 [Uloborus diversus]
MSVTPSQSSKETEPTPAEDSKDGLPPFGDDAKAELEFFESLMDDTEDDESKEESKKPDEDEFLSVTVLYPDQLRRQGDLNPEFGQRQTRPGVEFDDPQPPKADDRFPPPPVYPPKRDRDQDNPPLLQLTQGGYRKPYESSISQRQEPDSKSDEDQAAKIQPQVSYSPAFRQPQYASFGPGPVLQNPFVAQHRNFVGPNSILPTSVQSGFLNTPPVGFTDFANFQASFPAARDNGGYPSLMQDPGLVPLFQSPLFQNSQYQLVDPSRTLQGHLLSGSYETVDRPDYAAYFRHPTPPSPQFQVPPNYYGAVAGNNVFGNPFLANNPASPPFTPRYIRFQSPGGNPVPPNGQRQQDIPRENQPTKLEEPTPNEPDPVPFGTRLQAPPQDSQTDFYMRYPVRDAGYATEESLPSQNATEDDSPARRFFPLPRPFGRDPYRDALNVLQQQPSTDSRVNSTEGETFFRNRPFGDYPNLSTFHSPAFHPAMGGSGNAFERPDANFQFMNPARPGSGEGDGSVTPACALQSNASMCFEDKDYPRQDVHYSLNSDAYVLERFTTPGLGAEPNRTSERSICGADVRYGAPLRGKNAQGRWKVIVNMDSGLAEGRFTQMVRLEVCRSSGDPCSHTDDKVKTSCVQQYSLQSLLSWSTDRGVHSDLYRLPVACSCQLVDA